MTRDPSLASTDRSSLHRSSNAGSERQVESLVAAVSKMMETNARILESCSQKDQLLQNTIAAVLKGNAPAEALGRIAYEPKGPADWTKNARCYTCGEMGHSRKECKVPVTTCDAMVDGKRCGARHITSVHVEASAARERYRKRKEEEDRGRDRPRETRDASPERSPQKGGTAAVAAERSPSKSGGWRRRSGSPRADRAGNTAGPTDK